MVSRARARQAVATELARCEAQRDELDRLIARLRRVAAWLDRTPARSPAVVAAPAESLTQACRAALRGAAPRALTPIEVRDALSTLAFPFTRFVNPMAAVHTVLKRLVRQGEAHMGIDDQGETRYGARPIAAIALDRAALGDERFLRKLLEAGSPEAAIKLVEARAQRPRRSGL